MCLDSLFSDSEFLSKCAPFPARDNFTHVIPPTIVYAGKAHFDFIFGLRGIKYKS